MMKKLILVAMLAIVPVSSAFATALVYDRAAVLKMIDQITAMEKQLAELQALKNAVTGLGNFKDVDKLLQSGVISKILPKSVKDAAKFSQRARQVYREFEKNLQLSPQEKLEIYYQKALRDRGMRLATDQTTSERIIDNANGREKVINKLRDHLKTATTAKEVADIQARIMVENTLLQNELLRVQGIRMQQATSELIEREKSIRRLGRDSNKNSQKRVK